MRGEEQRKVKREADEGVAGHVSPVSVQGLAL